ncbi:SnoaL-like domain containing protein [Rhabdaerophilaceae bacterium]
MDRRNVLGLGLAAVLPTVVFAQSDPSADIKALYARFLAAQNARDLVGVRATLLDKPSFLWISDGKPFWGPDALIERMSAFQKAEVWHVTPDETRARVIDVSPTSAYLFQPLVLRLGPKAGPHAISFLVNVLCVNTASGWRIAALFTTEENPS